MYYENGIVTKSYRDNSRTAHREVEPYWTYLKQGEYITQVGGRFGLKCNKIMFKTSTGRVIEGGGNGGDLRHFMPTGVEKPCIIALDGGYSSYLESV